jgi:hypothetical protein
MEQEFNRQININPNTEDLRTWWSFRENIAEDPSYAICFFDHFIGKEPNWSFPGSVVNRGSMARALPMATQEKPHNIC